MVIAAFGLLCFNFVTEDLSKSVGDFMHYVDAAEAECEEPAEIFSKAAQEDASPEFYQANSPCPGEFTWKEGTYQNFAFIQMENGFVEEFYDGEIGGSYCYSGLVLIPGTTLMNKAVLGIAYFVFLCYLFLGISIVADIFMEAIEVITS
jgi:hypothetical protein